MNAVGKVFGIAGLVAGVVGAAALGGVTAQRVAIRKLRSGGVAGDNPEENRFDHLPVDRTYTVVTDDGVLLHVEEVGPADAPMTVVFSHGWALRLGSWHFQRVGLGFDPYGTAGALGLTELVTDEVDPQDTIRMVFYDLRSHGRSTRSPTRRPTMDDLAGDLAAVLKTAVPQGPMVLIGHSMGGMAVLSLAGRGPEFFADRVAGVGLISTSATEAGEVGRRFAALYRSGPVVKIAGMVATRYAGLIERGRASTRDAAWLITRLVGFARQDVPAPVVDYLDEMLTGTSIDVIADFAPGLIAYDRLAALPALIGIPTLVLCGDGDRMTPPANSELIAQALPGAELVEVEKAGHLPLMEAPTETNEALRRLMVKARDYARARLSGDGAGRSKDSGTSR